MKFYNNIKEKIYINFFLEIDTEMIILKNNKIIKL